MQHPLALANISHMLNSNIAFNKELLTAYLTVRKFQTFIKGRHYQLMMDHKPLVHAFSRHWDPWSSRLQRHLSVLAEFLSEINFHAGTKNMVTYSLSRAPIISATIIGIDLNALGAAKESCTELRAIIESESNSTSLSLQLFKLLPDGPPLVV